MDSLCTRSSQGLQDTLSPTHGRELIACFLLGIAVNLELPEEVEGKTFSTSCALRVEAPSERWSLKGQFTKSGEMHLTAVIQK